MAGKRKLLRGGLAVVALLVFAYSALQVFEYWRAGEESETVTEALIEEAVVERVSKAPQVDTPAESAPITVDFEALWQENQDIIAWIYSPDTPLNYPIVQSEDNDYYLRRLLNGEYNEGGTLFMDYRNQADLSDWNTLVYGHNMKNGSMFGSIVNYRRTDYYEEHPCFYLLTPEGDYKAEVLAGYVTDAYSDIYVVPMDQEEKCAYVQESLSKSTFQSQVSVADEDRLLSLSTCSYDSEDSRYVLIAVLRELDS